MKIYKKMTKLEIIRVATLMELLMAIFLCITITVLSNINKPPIEKLSIEEYNGRIITGSQLLELYYDNGREYAFEINNGIKVIYANTKDVQKEIQLLKDKKASCYISPTDKYEIKIEKNGNVIATKKQS